METHGNGAEPQPLIRVQELRTYFPTSRQGFLGRRGSVKAVDGLTFDVYKGETLGLVGESGCGKSTTGRTIIRLIRATSGSVWYDGRDLTKVSERDMRRLRQKLQIVFQDAYASVSSRMRVQSIILGTVLFTAFLIIFSNLVVDVAIGFVDPRIRYD